MNKLFRAYTLIDRPVLQIVSGIFFLQLINTSFFLILNLMLRKQGYPDSEIAELVSYRFMGTLALAFPTGLLIRGRRLKPFFLIAGAGLPIASWFVLEMIRLDHLSMAKTLLFVWGILFMFVQVCALPFIIRNTRFRLQSEAITLNYAMYSLGQIFSGLMISGMISAEAFEWGDYRYQFTDLNILKLISVLGIISFFSILPAKEKLDQPEVKVNFIQFHRELGRYDWKLIFYAMIPTFLLSTGAGLTIPFINLFFNAVFGMDSDAFSEMGSVAAVLVFGGATLVPYIKRKFGFEIAITLSQTLAVIFLIIMAATEWVSDWPGMIWVAIFCFLLRQPLMNMAAPMTSELTMTFVGERNRELMSSLIASIWSGAYVISAKIFQWLRGNQLPYYSVLLITAALYAVGVVAYYMIIRANRRKQKHLALIQARSNRTSITGIQA
jgi:hypothetical protein